MQLNSLKFFNLATSSNNCCYYSDPEGEWGILSVRLSVHEHISGTTGPMFTKFCAQIPYGRGWLSPPLAML